MSKTQVERRDVAALSSILLLAACVCICAPAQPSTRVVPTWTGNPHGDADVYLTKDGHEIVVLVPDGSGKRNVVRVNLCNDVVPLVSQSLREISSGSFANSFTIRK